MNVKKRNKDLQKLTFVASKTQIDSVKKIASGNNKSMSETIRDAIDDKIKKENKK